MAQTAPVTPMRVEPNPAGGQARISFEMKQAGPVSCIVYDAAGKVATVLADGQFQAGAYRLNWDGASANPGVYFCHLVTPAGASAVRITSVR